MKFPVLTVPASALAALLATCSLSSTTLAQADVHSLLTMSIGVTDISTLYPHRETEVGDKGMVSEMFNGFVRFPPRSAHPTVLEPDLAATWDRSPESKIWTFHLCNGGLFHGRYGELKAADVVYSIERAADPKRLSFTANRPLQSLRLALGGAQ